MSFRFVRSQVALALTSLLFVSSALAAPTRKDARGHGSTAKLEPPAHRAPAGRSIGSPTEGRLVGGAHLNESTYLRIVPAYAAGDARWGLEALVGLIDRAARSVRKQFPDAVLSAGHLSRNGGGEIDRHASHESGRDADIGFYVKNQKGKGIYADHFVAFTGDGAAATWPGAQFDDAKNWAFIAALAGDTQVRISHIFVAQPLRARLLAYAEKIGAPHAIRVRASELMAQPRGALPHDDHFHVRIGCPSGMDKCIEQPLAKHRPAHDKGAVASAHGHTPPKSAPASAHAHVPAHAEAPSKAVPSRAAEDDSKSESLIPSLAPIVPGLDSVVIPAPLAGAQPSRSEEKTVPQRLPETFPAAPIDDPDGVLEPLPPN